MSNKNNEDNYISYPENKKNLVEITIYLEKTDKHNSETILKNNIPIVDNIDDFSLDESSLEEENKIEKSDVSFSKLLTKSFLPFCALFLLNQNPKYGNELLVWLKQHSILWSASPGTVYPLLKQMEKDNLVEGHWGPGLKRPRYIYSITEKGRERFEKDSSSILPQIKSAIKQLQSLISEINS